MGRAVVLEGLGEEASLSRRIFLGTFLIDREEITWRSFVYSGSFLQPTAGLRAALRRRRMKGYAALWEHVWMVTR